MLPHPPAAPPPPSARGLSLRRGTVGPFPSGAPGSASMFGGRALGRPGVDRSPRPRGRRDRPPLARDPRWGRLCRPGGCAGLSLDPARAPGAAGAQGLDFQRPDLPGPGDPPARPPQPRPLRLALGRGLPARGPPLAQLPQGHCRRCPPLHPLPEGQTWGPLPGMAGPARKRRAGGGARSDSSHFGPPRSAPRPPAQPARPPRRPQPRLPSPGWHHSPPPDPHARAPGSVAQPTFSLFSSAITTCPGSGAAPGPSGGRPPLLQPLAAARARGEWEAPPCRLRAHRPHAGAPARPAARAAAPRGERAWISRCRLAPSPSPARSGSRSRCAGSSSPFLFSFSSFASSGAEVGKPAPAAGDHRELKQETPNPGENPGGVGRDEGSCWNLSGLAGPLRPREVPAPPLLAPSPGIPTSPLRSPCPGRRRLSAQLRLLHPAVPRIIPWAARESSGCLPFPC